MESPYLQASKQFCIIDWHTYTYIAQSCLHCLVLLLILIFSLTYNHQSMFQSLGCGKDNVGHNVKVQTYTEQVPPLRQGSYEHGSVITHSPTFLPPNASSNSKYSTLLTSRCRIHPWYPTMGDERSPEVAVSGAPPR